MVSLDEIKGILGDVLQNAASLTNMGAESPLLGSVPEFDSMAVVSILTAIEENYGIDIEDDEVSADIFETIGTLLDFVNERV
jgi:acyl carrier protein